MNRTEYLETSAWVKGEKKHWSPTVKINPGFCPGLAGAITGYPGHLLATPPALTVALGLYRPRDPGCISLRRDLWDG